MKKTHTFIDRLKRLLQDETKMAWAAALLMSALSFAMARHALSAFPSSDDWNAGCQAKASGVWGAFQYFYRVHHGRYVLNLVWPWIMKDNATFLFKYHAVGFFLHVLFLSGIYYAGRQFAPHLKRPYALAGAAAFALYAYALPYSAGEVFYILSGSIHYLGGYAAGIIALASARHATRLQSGWTRRGVVLLCGLATFVTIGSSEAVTITFLFLCAWSVALDWYRRRRLDLGIWLFPVFCAAIGGYIAAKSPAHVTNTLAQVSQAHDFGKMFIAAASDFVYYVSNTLGGNFWVLGSIWIPLFLASREKERPAAQLPAPWIIGLGWLIIVFLLFLPQYFYGFQLYARTSVVFFFLCAVLMAATFGVLWDRRKLLFPARLQPRLERGLKFMTSARWMILVILFSGLLQMRWVMVPLGIIRHERLTRAYVRTRNEMVENLKRASGHLEIKVDPPAKLPKPVHLGYCEVGAGDCHSYTDAFTAYFGISREQLNIDPGVNIR